MDIFEFCQITQIIREIIPEVKDSQPSRVISVGYDKGLLTVHQYIELNDWLLANEHLFEKKTQ